MSYTVIARKYRPQVFEEVIGQEHVTVTLANAIKKDQIGQAYLFSGSRGVGKTTTARIFAKAVNCKKGPSPVPCNKCEPCVGITEGNNVDVYEIDGASNRGIDEIRGLREKIKYSPLISKFKLYIIDEVHMLTTEAFNALLKTLEEPPPHIIFIFATTELHKVPDTIISRCQVFKFRRVSNNEIVKNLEYILKKEKIKYKKEVLCAIAKLGEGSVRDSQSFLDQLLAFTSEEISIEHVNNILGITSHSSISELTENIIQNNVKESLDLIYKLNESGTDMGQFVKDLLFFYRDLLVIKDVDKPGELIDNTEDYIEALARLKEQISKNRLIQFIELCLNLHKEMKYSTLPLLLIELTVLKLHHICSSKGLDEVLNELERLKSSVPEGSADPLKKKIVDENRIEPVELVKNRWKEITKKTGPAMTGYLHNVKIKSGKDGLVLEFKTELNYNKITEPEKKRLLEKKIFEITGLKLKITTELKKSKKEEIKQQIHSPAELVKIQHDEELRKYGEIPIVKKIKELFGGEIANIKTY